MLFAAKKEVILDKVMKCGRDTKILYSIVNNITNVNKENPLRDRTSDKELANQFVDYFLGKSVKITKVLEEKALYIPYD